MLQFLDNLWRLFTFFKCSIISGLQLNIIASILELVKYYLEVIVASKCGPLARIEKQAMSKKLDLLKSFSNIREAPA